jgi:hypothetical protein
MQIRQRIPFRASELWIWILTCLSQRAHGHRFGRSCLTLAYQPGHGTDNLGSQRHIEERHDCLRAKQAVERNDVLKSATGQRIQEKPIRKAHQLFKIGREQLRGIRMVNVTGCGGFLQFSISSFGCAHCFQMLKRDAQRIFRVCHLG